uniref:Uncharacterized protein n=1 Tax=Anguilla anguilla TaxID=7936 RepID=A0A0E9TFS9_ANGAN
MIWGRLGLAQVNLLGGRLVFRAYVTIASDSGFL